MSKKMKRLLARRGIYFKTDPDHQGGGGSGGEGDEAEAAKLAAEKAAADAAKAKNGEEGKEGDGEKLTSTERKLLAESMSRKDKIKELVSAMDLLKADKEATAAQLETFKSTLGDIDLDEVKTLLSNKKAAETKALEDRGEYDRILAQIKETNAAAMAELQAKIDELSGEKTHMSVVIDEMTLGRSFTESPYIREFSTLPASIARKEFASHFELKEGKLVAYDKPSGSKERTPLVDANGEYLTFEAAIKTLYEGHTEAKTLIKSHLKSGSGAKPVDQLKNREEERDAKLSGLSKIQAALEKAAASKK